MNLPLIYKAAGAVCVAASCLFISGGYARSARLALDAALDALAFVRHAADCIRYRADEVDVIVSSYESNFSSFRAAWRHAAETTLCGSISLFAYDERTAAVMTEFCRELGRGYREPQLELCRRTEAALSSHAESLSSSLSDRLRVARAVCVFACASFLILFI